MFNQKKYFVLYAILFRARLSLKGLVNMKNNGSSLPSTARKILQFFIRTCKHHTSQPGFRQELCNHISTATAALHGHLPETEYEIDPKKPNSYSWSGVGQHEGVTDAWRKWLALKSHFPGEHVLHNQRCLQTIKS